MLGKTRFFVVSKVEQREIPEPPGFFSSVFNYVEMGLKKIFGFKGEDSHDNSTSISTDSHLLKVLSNPTDRTQQLLGSGSVGNVSTVPAAVAVIVVKEDHTTQKQP
ncbi:hypothetical protein PRIPAC_84481 [Pristionchus pacificus]|nr:hypothetical protein PRIPAC_84481 [Pristionchus pacificus]|eukprot:PDM67377.1 hypothetical protein PRIPAC_48794 [Pristionchus pacificus]